MQKDIHVNCDGDKKEVDKKEKVCPECNGKGVIIKDDEGCCNQREVPCPSCS